MSTKPSQQKPKTAKAPRKATLKTEQKTARKANNREADNNKNIKRTLTKTPNVNPIPMEDMMTNTANKIEEAMQQAQAAQKESWDIMMKSGNQFMKGMEELMKVSMTHAQKTAEKNAQTVKTLMACKTVNEYAEAQAKAAQTNFDEFMSGVTKLSEVSVKVATDCLEPVNDQISKTMSKMTGAAA